MTGRWLVVGVLVLATGCGEASSPGSAAEVAQVVRPTAVPSAEGTVTTSQSVVVSDDGSGPQLCFGGIDFGGPPSCSGASVTGWDWSAVDDVSEQDGVRWGTYALTGTFDGATFAVTEVSGTTGPEPYEFSIPCEEPAGGWQVQDASRRQPAEPDEGRGVPRRRQHAALGGPGVRRGRRGRRVEPPACRLTRPTSFAARVWGWQLRSR